MTGCGQAWNPLGLTCHGCRQPVPQLFHLGLGWRCGSCLSPGTTIWWAHGTETRGPAPITDFFLDEGGELWVTMEQRGMVTLVLAKLITKLEPIKQALG